MAKTLPKSLHTITVLYRIALDQFERDPTQSAHSCVAHGVNLLYFDWPHDPHGLIDAAVAKLQATYPHHFAQGE